MSGPHLVIFALVFVHLASLEARLGAKPFLVLTHLAVAAVLLFSAARQWAGAN